MSFDDWLGKAWDDHAGDPAAVAARITTDGVTMAADDPQRTALARLAHHVYGEHLGRWDDGRALLATLSAAASAGESLRAQIRVLDASLALCAGAEPAAAAGAALTRPERVRVQAFAAGNLAGRDTARASALLNQALAEAETPPLPDDDPAIRALAVTGNNLACTLEEKPARSDAERALMILAAQTARRYWARAGTWLETERAEYRLAHTWLKAGDAAQARRHAEACLGIVRAHDEPPLEAFFGWEALGLADAAAGDPAGHGRALAQARAAFERLDEGDRGWCQASLDKLAAAAPA